MVVKTGHHLQLRAVEATRPAHDVHLPELHVSGRSQHKTDRQVRKMANAPTVNSIDEYIAGFPPETQKMLEEMRALIKASAPPDATETISYAIPTLDLNGHHLVSFAGYERHIGFCPAPRGVEAFETDLEPLNHAPLAIGII